jgi:hypothetical protein
LTTNLWVGLWITNASNCRTHCSQACHATSASVPRPRHQTPTSSLDLASNFDRPRHQTNSERVAPPPTSSLDLDQPTSPRPHASTSSLDLASNFATRPPTNLQLWLDLDTQLQRRRFDLKQPRPTPVVQPKSNSRSTSDNNVFPRVESLVLGRPLNPSVSPS